MKAFEASLDAARHPTPDEFSHSVTRCAVAHLALGVANTDPRPPTDPSIEPGFTSADTRAIELLSDIVGRYIETIGLNASENANAAGRTSTNAYDVLNAFGSLTPALSIKDLHAYARDKGLEVPFDRDVSSFPKRRNQRGSAYGSGVSSAQFHSAPRPTHVPSFLPPLPELDKKIKATKTQSSTDKSKKRIRQEVETQAALTQLHGGSSSSSSSSNSSSSSSTGAAAQNDESVNQKPSNLKYQKGSGVRRQGSLGSGSRGGEGNGDKGQQILNGTYKN